MEQTQKKEMTVSEYVDEIERISKEIVGLSMRSGVSLRETQLVIRGKIDIFCRGSP